MHRILIVDDNVDAADTLALMLSLLGHHTQALHSAPLALQQASQAPPDFMFVDLGMPDMDGFALCRAFRARNPAAATRLIALTGWGDPATRERTRTAGFDHHLTKPAALETLVELFGAPPVPS